jgi:hypothetical protein
MNTPTYLYKAGQEPIIVDACDAKPFLADGWKDTPQGEITNGEQESTADEAGEDAAKGRKKRVLENDDSN